MDARRLALALVVLSGLALAGCTIASQESEYPDEETVRDQLTSLDTLEADVVTEIRTGNNSTTIRMHVERDFEAGTSRTAITEGPNDGLTIVLDGERTWYYEPDRDVVQVFDDPGHASNVSGTVDTVGSIYERLDDDGSGEEEVEISQAPTVPASRDRAPTNNTIRLPLGDNVSVSNAGTDTVDGRAVNVVELDVEDERSQIQNATYYIDQEWHFPLKSRVAVTVGGQTRVTTTTYTNVSLDEPIDPETFEFEPPSSADVVQGGNGSFRQYSSRETLVETVDSHVPHPSLPPEFEFEAAEVTPTGSGQTIAVVYADRSTTITVTKLTGLEANLSTDAEELEIAGQPARRRALGETVAVAWTCRGNTYSVVGPEDGPAVTEIARSISCS